MKTIKRQLREFYAAQGIGVRRAEKLIKSDLNAVRRHSNTPDGIAPEDALDQVLVWTFTPQGHRYWAARHGYSTIPHDHPSPLHA